MRGFNKKKGLRILSIFVLVIGIMVSTNSVSLIADWDYPEPDGATQLVDWDYPEPDGATLLVDWDYPEPDGHSTTSSI